MPRPLRVLVVDDHAADAEEIVAELERSGFDPQCSLAVNEADVLAALSAETPDVIITEHALPELRAQTGLAAPSRLPLEAPVIVSGCGGRAMCGTPSSAGGAAKPSAGSATPRTSTAAWSRRSPRSATSPGP